MLQFVRNILRSATSSQASAILTHHDNFRKFNPNNKKNVALYFEINAIVFSKPCLQPCSDTLLWFSQYAWSILTLVIHFLKLVPNEF